jgi:hypothetical protein
MLSSSPDFFSAYPVLFLILSYTTIFFDPSRLCQAIGLPCHVYSGLGAFAYASTFSVLSSNPTLFMKPLSFFTFLVNFVLEPLKQSFAMLEMESSIVHAGQVLSH